jgi:uncharacterized iron-regulated protein
VESWYSWHSLDDYKNNIESIKNGYLGGIDNNTRQSASLSAFIASRNATLDKQVKEQIETCITKIGNIGAGGRSFYEVVKAKSEGNASSDQAVQDAVDACERLAELFGQMNELID